VSGTVMDSSAILAFLNGDAPDLLARFEDDVIISEVTLKTLEWSLIRSGGKRLEILSDLKRLGLDGVVFGERQLESVNSVLNAVPGLEFEGAIAASLAQGKKTTLITANPVWHGVQVSGLEVQIFGLSRVAPSVKPASTSPSIPVSNSVMASTDGGGQS
jgi:PIN domain nuclease of toxin-antitoxin system